MTRKVRDADNDDEATVPAAPAGTQRLDKWLWFARVAKTRTLAAGLVTQGRVRLNSTRCDKPAQAVRPGDVLTIVVGHHVRILEVVLPGVRRGSGTEAQALYKDLTPPPPPRDLDAPKIDSGERDPGSGRPTKRDRRKLDRLMSNDDE